MPRACLLRPSTGAQAGTHAASCTSDLRLSSIGKSASADGSTMLGSNADDVGLFGSIDLRPATTHAPGSMRAVWDSDSQLYTGQIPQVNATYNVVGNTNEYGVIITETMFGGLQAQRFH
jgi:hypothetical protein